MAKCSILYLEMHWPQSYLLQDMGTVCLEFACKRAYVTWLMENHSFRGRQLLKPKMKAGVDVENRDVRRPRETEDAKHPVCHFGVMMTWSWNWLRKRCKESFTLSKIRTQIWKDAYLPFPTRNKSIDKDNFRSLQLTHSWTYRDLPTKLYKNSTKQNKKAIPQSFPDAFAIW